MDNQQSEYKKIPAVDKLLTNKEIIELISNYNIDLVKFSIRNCIDNYREIVKTGKSLPSIEETIQKIIHSTKKIADKSLKAVVNANGVIIHTNLGRAPFGQELLNQINNTLKGYNNLEFDLDKATRGHRDSHARKLLQFLTGAEDALVVNNNAAAVMFLLRTFAKNKEVIISRGELIEIGGSFRIPDIMAASDCKMVEVGATNKTKLSDYENNITKDTALIFKTHTSNYVIKGFTKEASLEELVALGKKHNIPVIYDIGSGLLRKVDNEALKSEPDVKQALATGIDLICFSGDKLLGGPQAGIIAGKKKYIEILRKEPLMRALRVSKTTLAILETSCQYYLNDKELFEKNLIFKTLKRTIEEKHDIAKKLQNELLKYKIKSEITESKGQYGGGTLPEHELDSFAVRLMFEGKKNNSEKAEKLYRKLLTSDNPVLGILKQGNIYFDVLTVFDDIVGNLACYINDSYQI
jgi:L-seryl-tRNA(Ser) seleniumtransferase